MTETTRRRRKTKDDDVMITNNVLFLLVTLYDRKMYCYEMCQFVKETYDIDVPIQTVYTTVKNFVNLRWIDKVSQDDMTDKVLYTLSDDGKKKVNKKISDMKKTLKKIKDFKTKRREA